MNHQTGERTPRRTHWLGRTMLASWVAALSVASLSCDKPPTKPPPEPQPPTCGGEAPASPPGPGVPVYGAAVEAFGDGKPHQITYDKYSLMIDGKREYIWSGEFHPFRLPNPDLWRDMLQKYKAIGMNAVSFYFSWAYHSPAPGVYDFSSVRDVEQLLDIAEEVGLYVIARPGPYINAEVDSGGFPGWLQTQAGRARSDADDYQAAWEQYFDAINPILARHQLTDGGGSVILYQLENEYDRTDSTAQNYMEELKAAVRADGITVPLFHNDKGRELRWACGKGAPDLYATDTYPGTSVTDYEFLRHGEKFTPPRCGVEDRPFFWAEFQGGWFQPWGGKLYEDNRDAYGPTFERITYGNNINNHFTLQNLYMLYGGTNWGWQADPNVVYTSYDYHAAFDEYRQQTNKIPPLKQQGYLVDAVADLRQLDNLPEQVEHSNPELHVDGDVNPVTGAKFFFVRQENIKSVSRQDTTLRVQVSDGDYTVPQQAGTALTINGQDYKILVAGYNLGAQRLVYSTAEIYTHQRIGEGDVAVLHTREGEAAELVLRYASEPSVQVLSGGVTSTWDSARNDLRLNWSADGLARVRVTEEGRAPLELLLTDSDTASTFWSAHTARGPVLARGARLIREVQQDDTALRLVGDVSAATDIEIWAGARFCQLTWNQGEQTWSETEYGTKVISVPGPQPVTLPPLTSWKHTVDQPEAAPAFDDSAWLVAAHTTTNNPTKPSTLPVLYADDYGFHYGDVWYRGRFQAVGNETGISLTAGTGKAGAWAVWLNGTYLGTVRTSPQAQNSSKDIPFPSGLLEPGQENQLSVLVRNMGHNENGGSNDGHKNPRGLLAAKMMGSGSVISWRIQGARGGESLVEPLTGPLNNGGLHGERSGYTLPGFSDETWESVTLPQATVAPGLHWYRTEVQLDLPEGQDIPIALRFGGETAPKYRALIFVNGYNLGQYVNDVGPQRDFSLPQGILRHRGKNTLALAVWSDDGAGPGPVEFVTKANAVTGLVVRDVERPSYAPARYTGQRATTVRLDLPAEAADGASFTATARLEVPSGEPAVTGVRFTLEVPSGWVSEPTGTTPDGSASWTVTVPSTGRTPDSPPALLRATATYTQASATRSSSDVRFVGRPIPPPVAGQQWISDMTFDASTNGWGPVERDMSNGEQAAGDGRPLTVGGTEHGKGLGTHADSSVTVTLKGCESFTAVVGVDDEVGDRGDVTFEVIGDGKSLWKSPTLTGSSAPLPVSVDVTGVTQLRLVVDDLGSNGKDHADWASAKVTGCTSP
ncbi:beta-galactosidase [Cystobacter ferrugineus]|nr:beta-galactosidase [Cystobacter ferrugineus]